MDVMQRRRELMGVQAGGLPRIYQKVECLQSQPGTYIDSGVQITSDLIFELTFKLLEVTNGRYIQGVYLGNNGVFYLYVSTGSAGGYLQLAYGSPYKNTTRRADTDKHLLRCEIIESVAHCYMDNIDVWSSSAVNKFPTNSIFIAGSSMGSSIIPCNTYSVKMIKGNKLIKEFVPCVRKSDSKPGMYDTVSKTFYTNAGTGEFIVPA